MGDSLKQFDLFPTSEPEIKGQLLAFTVLVRNLLDLLISKGVLTKEEAQTLCRHSDLQTSLAIWDNLTGEMPPADMKRIEEQAVKFLSSLRENLKLT